MKKRKRNLLQKVMAVLLSAILTVGMLAEVMPMKVQAQENGEGNTTGSITLRVHGYESDKWKTVTTHCPTDIITEISHDIETVHQDDYTDFKYVYRLNVKQFENFYVYYDGKLIKSAAANPNRECDWGTVELWPVQFMDGDRVLDKIYVPAGGTVSKPSAEPEKENFVFEEWVTENGGDTPFAFEADLPDPDYRPACISDATNIYASWRQDAAEPAESEASIDNPYAGAVILNGTAVIITEGADSSLTKLYEDKNADGILDAGELPIPLPNESGSLTDGYDLSGSQIFGGKSSDSYAGDIKITMLGGSVMRVEGTYFGEVDGDFHFRMTGGTLEEVMSAAAAGLKGNSDIVIGGDAVVTKAVYGGAMNSDTTIDGNVSITVEGNAYVGDGGSYDGIFAGGQQPGNVINGAAAVTVKGGTVNGHIYSDLFATAFQEGVVIDIQGGLITGFIQGATVVNSQMPSVEIRVGSGAVINGSVIGAHNANVESTSVRVDGGTIGGQLIGALAAKAGTVSIEVNGGSVQGLVVGKANPGGTTEEAWKKGIITVRGGSFGERIMLRNRGVAESAEASEIRLEGNPAFGENSRILLQSGEAITQTGAITGGDGSVKVDVGSVNQEGTLIVRAGGGRNAESQGIYPPELKLESDIRGDGGQR